MKSKFLVAVLSLVLMTGCANMTPRQKTITQVGVSVLIVGATIAYGSSDNHSRATRPILGPISPIDTVQ